MTRYRDVPWWRALTIAERRGLTGAPTSIDAARASARANRWEELAVFHRTSLDHDAAVAPLGVAWTELLDLLGEEDESLRARAGANPPDWLLRAERWHRAAVDHGPHEVHDRELYNLVDPLVEGAALELVDGLRERIVSPALTGELFLRSLAESVPVKDLSSITVPCLVQDMHDERRSPGGTLVDVPETDVYQCYTALLREARTQERLYARYPLMLRGVVERLGMWVERRLELATALDRDLPIIAETLLGGRRPTWVTAAFDAGDSHRRGRSVVLLDSDAGRFVYKPRAPRMEGLVEEVLTAVRSADPFLPPLRVPAVVSGEDCFWQEFIESAPVRPETAAPMAEALGALTAVLHALRANDFHHENVVLGEDGPVAIDLESVLHTSRDYRVERTDSATNAGADALDSSCLGVGVLPHPLVLRGAPDVEPADVSVIGYTPGRAGGLQMPRLLDAGTARMRIEYERAVFDSEPGARGRELLHAAAASFEDGFDAAYRAVMAAREAILGLVRGRMGAESRFIARPTMVYGKILAESYHPDFMGDALDRHLVLGKLLAHFVGRGHRAALIGAETADLLAGDIPIFALDVATGRLTASDGTSLVAQLEAPADSLARSLAVMGPSDLSIQDHVIRLAFACLPDAPASPEPVLLPPSGAGSLDDDKLEAAAALLDAADGLLAGAEGLGSITLSASAPGRWSLTPGGLDLYSGTAGIAMAAGLIAEMTGSPRAAGLVTASHATALGLRELVSNDDAAVRKNIRDLSTGAYGQVSGVALLTATAHRAGGAPGLGSACASAVRMLGQMAPADGFHDVISGNAGGILAAAAVADIAGEESRSTIRILADRLVASAVRDDDGLSWPQAGDGARLLGFSHGASGAAWALGTAARVLDDDSLLAAAHDALAWESSHVTPAGDWPDLRPESTASGAGTMRAWCHGSPGAGFARALLLSTVPGLVTRAASRELRTALVATTETLDALVDGTGDVGNESLCHGNVGNILCLEAMWEALADRDEARARTAPYWRALLRRRSAWRSGARGGTALPDLMMGLTGMAWGLAFSARSEPRVDLLSLGVR